MARISPLLILLLSLDIGPALAFLISDHSPTKTFLTHGASSSARTTFLSLSSDGEPSSSSYQVSIEYCTGCRWGLRGFWLAQELLTTFASEPQLAAVTLLPSRPSVNSPAVFRVHLKTSDDDALLLWDRKEKGGFPEAKALKQLVRDVTSPDLYLGHSDTADKKEAHDQQATTTEEVIDLKANVPEPVDMTLDPADILDKPSPNVAITYCTGCRWLLRSAYFAQELMTTFGEEINSLTLLPSRPPAKGGAFVVTVNGDTVVWDRAEEGRFPETKELKQKIRDLLNPERDLGHVDGGSSAAAAAVDAMDDEDAEEARKYFGVQ